MKIYLHGDTRVNKIPVNSLVYYMQIVLLYVLFITAFFNSALLVQHRAVTPQLYYSTLSCTRLGEFKSTAKKYELVNSFDHPGPDPRCKQLSRPCMTGTHRIAVQTIITALYDRHS